MFFFNSFEKYVMPLKELEARTKENEMNTRTYIKDLLIVITLSIFAISCTSDGTSSSSSAGLTISGDLGGVSGASYKLSKVGTLAVTDYKVRCVTLSSSPVAGEGAVNADGTFSLSISVSGSESVPVGCFIVKAADSSVAATFSFDSGSTGMDGNSTKKGSVNAGSSGTIDFGAINFDADKGTAVVAESNITRTVAAPAASGSWVDPTGEWTMTCITSDSTYSCPSEAVNNQFPIYLHQLAASHSTEGDQKGLAIWQSESTFNACGKTENLDAILGSGWTIDDTGQTVSQSTDFSFSSSLPVASSVNVPSWGICDDSVATTCDQVKNGGTDSGTNATDGWGNGSYYTDADCVAMCVIEGMRDSGGGSCQPRFSVNHGFTSTASPGDIDAEYASYDPTANSGAGTTSSYISQNEDPDGRHVIGQLSIEGGIGTVMSTKERTEHFCEQSASGCTDRSCVLVENVRVTMNQSSASAAVVEVVISESVDTANSDAQCTQNVNGNWMYQEFGAENKRTEKFLLNAAKN